MRADGSVPVPPRIERLERTRPVRGPQTRHAGAFVIIALMVVVPAVRELVRTERTKRALRAGVASLAAATTDPERAALLRRRVPHGTPLARAADSLAMLGFRCAREDRTTRPGATGPALACARPIELPDTPILRVWATDSAGVVSALAYAEAVTIGGTREGAGRDTVFIRDVALR